MFIQEILAGAAGSSIGKNGHGSVARELLKIANKMRLIEIFGLHRDGRPIQPIPFAPTHII
jgi:hypothetical protein